MGGPEGTSRSARDGTAGRTGVDERRITELRHEHTDDIASNDHSHVADYCVDLFVLEADLEEISGFVGKLRAIEDVETVDYSLVPLESIGQLQDT